MLEHMNPQTELEAKTRDLEFQKFALDQHAIVSVTDSKGIITYVNKKFCEISQYNESELVSYSHAVVNSGYHDKNFWRLMWAQISQGRVWQGEVKNRTKEGGEYWVETTIVPFTDENNIPEKYVSIRTEITLIKQSEALLKKQLALVNSIQRAQTDFIKQNQEVPVLDAILSDLKSLSNSEFGFIAELKQRESGENYLKIHAISDIAWDKTSQEIYQRMETQTMEFVNLDNLFGHVISQQACVITNDPKNHVASKGLPAGHPVLINFLGIPLFTGKTITGLVALANSKKDYDQTVVDFIKPLVSTCANLIEAYRNIQERQLANQKIEKINKELEQKIRDRTSELEKEKESLQAIIIATALTKGNEFLQLFVKNVAIAVNARSIFLARINSLEPGILNIIASCRDGEIIPGGKLEIGNTSLSSFEQGKEIVIEKDFSTIALNHELFNAIEAIIAIPFFSTEGKLNGYIVSLHDKPLEDRTRFQVILGVFAISAGAEIEMQDMQQLLELRASQQQDVAMLGQMSLKARSISELILFCLNMVKNKLAVEYCDICKVKINEGKIRVLATSDGMAAEEDYIEQFVNSDSQIIQATKYKEPVIIENYDLEKTYVIPNYLNKKRYIASVSCPIEQMNGENMTLNIYSSSKRVFSLNDINYLKAVSYMLGSAIDRINSEKELTEAYQLKSEFLANMSHELRTPLNAIIGFSKTMLNKIDGPVTDDQVESLNHIYGNGKHLLALINDILDMSKIEAGKMELIYSQSCLKTLFDEVCGMMGSLISDKNLKLIKNYDEENIDADVDPLRMKQILQNLLSNAIKFTEQGDITIGYKRVTATSFDVPHNIKIQLQKDDSYILCYVQDTGVGIEQAQINSVFIDFKQVDASSTKKFAGTGLGLGIVKKLLKLHGGDIWVVSLPGQGSTFNFLFPEFRKI